MQPFYVDIAVIGGGASGLAAAIEAKQYGGADCRIAVIEKNARLGKKILATGNGRCNLGNIDEKQKQHYSGTCSGLIEPLFKQFEGSEDFFKSLGVICRADSGRLYPYSNHAASVLDALRLQLQELRIDVYTDSEVLSLKYEKDIWKIDTSCNEFTSKTVIVACGGNAAPAMGTDGSFYDILKSLGHTIIPVTPALCPIYTKASLLKGLKGIRLLAKAYLYNKSGKLVHCDAGEVQLTEQALSGICIFNLASFVQEEDMYIQLDLLPHLTDYEVNDLLWNIYAQRSQWHIEDMLTGVFQKRVCTALFHAGGISVPMENFVYTLTPDDMDKLAKTIKAWRFPIQRLADWNAAQVTAGGIPGCEVNDNLSSVLYPSLYLAGEVLDIAGECGGYNLAWAWCSGVCAARAAVDYLKGRDSCDKIIKS